MEEKVSFKCQGESFEQIPDSIPCSLGITFPRAHTDRYIMALLAEELRKHKKDRICRVPFCVTVEAEAMGAKINLGNEKTGPMVESYLFNSVEDLQALREIDLEAGRIKEVLECVSILNKQDKIVVLSVEGPFTIASSLVDPAVLFKGLRKNKAIVDNFFKIIEKSIVNYMRKGIEKGARIISYADPVGSKSIVGPKLYKEVSGPISYNILKSIENDLQGVIVHLCGQTSTALEGLGLTESYPIKSVEGSTYGEAICQVMEKKKDTNFLGHKCIKRSPIKLATPVWGIKLLLPNTFVQT